MYRKVRPSGEFYSYLRRTKTRAAPPPTQIKLLCPGVSGSLAQSANDRGSCSPEGGVTPQGPRDVIRPSGEQPSRQPKAARRQRGWRSYPNPPYKPETRLTRAFLGGRCPPVAGVHRTTEGEAETPGANSLPGQKMAPGENKSFYLWARTKVAPQQKLALCENYNSFCPVCKADILKQQKRAKP